MSRNRRRRRRLAWWRHFTRHRRGHWLAAWIELERMHRQHRPETTTQEAAK